MALQIPSHKASKNLQRTAGRSESRAGDWSCGPRGVRASENVINNRALDVEFFGGLQRLERSTTNHDASTRSATAEGRSFIRRVRLADAELSAADVPTGAAHREAFVARYLPRFPCAGHSPHARTTLPGGGSRRSGRGRAETA